MHSEHAITCTDLVVDYTAISANSIRAVDCISFAVKRHSVTGILGVNGAGKTTTIRVLTGLRRPTSGSITVEGYNMDTDVKEIKRLTGVSFGGTQGLYGRLSPYENCELFALLSGSSQRQARVDADQALGIVEMGEEKHRPVEQLSVGMKQRVHIARALVNRPSVVYLDEPTAGLDPFSARNIRSFIPRLREEGKTVVLTTHLLFEADDLCDQIIILDRGAIVDEGNPESLKTRYSQGVILELYTPSIDLDATIGLSDALTEEFSNYVIFTESEMLDLGIKLAVRLRPSINSDDEVSYCCDQISDYLVQFGNDWQLFVRRSTLEEAFVAAINNSRETQR